MPLDFVVLTRLLRGKLLSAVDATAARLSSQAELGIFAGAHDQLSAFRNVTQDRAIAEAAIAGDHQNFCCAISLVQHRAQLLHTVNEALREVQTFTVGAILLPKLRVSPLARFFDG